MTRFVLPLAVFLALALALAAGLRRDPRELPSPLVGKPAPAFALPVLERDDGTRLRNTDLRGKVWVLNVWASWCGPCQVEHPLLRDFAAQSHAPLYGMNYKDQPQAARAWLARLGNPYAATLVDGDGRVGIDYGVYGVPETFVIDQAGIVRFRLPGPVTREVLEQKVLPLVRELNARGPGNG